MRVDRDGSTRRVVLTGELDLHAAEEFERELKRIETEGAATVVVDLSGLELIDSIGMRALLQARARARANKIELVLTPGPEHVQRVLEIAGIARVLPFADEAEPGATSRRTIP
jgi:anti-sigma B factor antagonist